MKKVIFVSYGTGGAEGLNSVYNRLKELGVTCDNIGISDYVKSRLDDRIDSTPTEVLDLILEAKEKFDGVIVVNERASGVEEQTRISEFCKEHDITNYVFLDLDNGYDSRFPKLPQFILTPSEQASEGMVKAGFPSNILIATGNPSMDDLVRINPTFKQEHLQVLYAVQPLLKYDIGDEYKVFDVLYSELSKHFSIDKFDIMLHPQNQKDGWLSYNSIENVNVLDYNYNVAKPTIHKYDIVCGYECSVQERCSIQRIPTVYYSSLEEDIKAYKEHRLTHQEHQYKENATENIVKVILDRLNS